MASTSRVEQALEYTGYSQLSSRNSFSIKNILNLPEESTAKPVQPSNASNEVSHARPAFPLVPRVVRPYAAFNIDGGFPLHSPPRHWLGTVVQQFTPQMFGWRLTRFFPGVTPYLRRKRPLRKRKQRPLFSQQQVQTLEREFAKRRYVTEVRRSELASRLKLTETQVKTWFQNRRTKWRKESRDELETALMDSKRRWKAENAEKADKLDSQSTLPSSASSSSAVPQQSSPLFIDLDNFKLTVTNKD